MTEFILIVLGVLCALAVEAWMDRARDAEAERNYLVRLAEDLELNAEAFERSVELQRRIEAHGRAVLPLLRNGIRNSSESAFLGSLYQASRGRPPAFVDATYEELLSTGGLGLIRDDELRAEIIRYHRWADRALLEFTGRDDRELFRDRIRQLIPAEIQEDIRNACPLEETEPLTCDADLSGSSATGVVQAIMRDPSVPEFLNFWMAALRFSVGYAESGVTATRDLLQLVRAEIN